MTNAPVLAVDYLKRSRLRVRAVEALIDVGDFADAVREAQEIDESVARALRTRAKARGLSLEEEVRRSLAESIAVKQEAFARRAAACRAATRRTRTRPPSDSAALIRRERDTRG
jgi:hypothetical protein